MKGFMRLRARAKLVELSDEERLAAELAAEAAAPADAAPSPPPPPPELPPSDCEIDKERGFDAIFGAAGVAPVPFPAEKLLRLLDGLRAMDATTRKMAVLAMDAADDNWDVVDCVADAQRKIAALEGYKHHLAAQVQGSERQTRTQITDMRLRWKTATTSIRTQIAEPNKRRTRSHQGRAGGYRRVPACARRAKLLPAKPAGWTVKSNDCAKFSRISRRPTARLDIDMAH